MYTYMSETCIICIFVPIKKFCTTYSYVFVFKEIIIYLEEKNIIVFGIMEIIVNFQMPAKP